MHMYNVHLCLLLLSVSPFHCVQVEFRIICPNALKTSKPQPNLNDPEQKKAQGGTCRTSQKPRGLPVQEAVKKTGLEHVQGLGFRMCRAGNAAPLSSQCCYHG